MNVCKRNNITSVWSINPTPNSFDFIDKNITLERLNENVNQPTNEKGFFVKFNTFK